MENEICRKSLRRFVVGMGLMSVSLFVNSCGSAPAPKNAAVANNAVSPSQTQLAAAVSPTATPAEVMPEGVKIERVQTAKFADGKLDDGWQWIDPDAQNAPTAHEFKDARLMMAIPTAKDLYGGNRTAPRLLKAVMGDFQVETHLKFDPLEDYQGAGLLVYKDGDNYIRFERAFGGLGGGGSGIRLDIRLNGDYTSLATPIDIPTKVTECDLKITRRLNVFSVYWREDENSEWRSVEDIETVFPETVQAGVVGCNTAAEITAEFTRIRLSPQPLQAPY